MVNIGVGPSNARTITDHVAVLRPHCWLMLGHCAGLRRSQQLGDYVLAHGYVREDNVLDQEVPLFVPVPPIAEVQVALQEAVVNVTGLKGPDVKTRMRTGTVATTANRNWELRYDELFERLNQQRAIAVDMESATDRRQRLPLPRALRHAAVRLGQAAARRAQAARHGQPPSTASGSTSTCRSASRRSASCARRSAPTRCIRASCAASTSRRSADQNGRRRSAQQSSRVRVRACRSRGRNTSDEVFDAMADRLERKVKPLASSLTPYVQLPMMRSARPK